MKKRLLAVFLTITMLVSLFPLPALALEGQRPEWAVTAFDPLDEGAAFQTVPQGGGEPVLPDTLTAWAYRIEDDTTVIVPPEQTAPEGEQTPADSPEEQPAPGEADPAPVEDGGDILTAALVENDPAPAKQQEPDIQQITIPNVTWTGSPEYGHNAPGAYIYTPVLPAAYIVDEGVGLPAVTVTVEAVREPEQAAENAEDAPAPLAADAPYSSDFSGSGTESDPYLIPDLATLEKFRDSVTSDEAYEGKHFKLTADIDMSERYGESEGKASWTPIGEGAGGKPEKPFNGTFDGDGHSITNLYIHDTKGFTYQGLFAVLGASGTIKNLTVDGTVQSTSSRIRGIGGICGWSQGTITNCTNEATVKGYVMLGGICGYQSGSGKITNCRNTGSIMGTNSYDNISNDELKTTPNSVGGICGQGYGIITDCTNEGRVEGYSKIGGICGTWFGNSPVTTIQEERCHNTGNIRGTQDVGGVCGSTTTRLEYCSNAGTVTGTENSKSVGGVCGSANLVYYCYNTGAVSGTTGVGGVCGGSTYAIYHSYNTGAVSGTNLIGGVCGGTNSSGVSVITCYNVGTVSGTSDVSGVLGSSVSSPTGCYYLDTCGAAGGGEAKTAAQFASGEVAYRLQGGPAALKWGQTVGQGLPELTNKDAKRVYKVTFKARMSNYAAAYANYGGTVTLPEDPPVSETVSGSEFYGWSKSSNASVPDFTADTQVTGDITVYAMMRKQFGEKDGEHKVETTYGTAATLDLSKCVKYANTQTATPGKFIYSIESGNDTLNATISDDTLTVPSTAPANENGYTLTIKAHEKDPVIFPYSAKPLGTEDFTFPVTVVIKKAAEAAPNAVIDYASEKLTALTANANYSITIQDGQSETVPADENGKISIKEEWMGKAFSVVKTADDNHSDSTPQSISIPSRPAAPTAPLKLTKTANSINSVVKDRKELGDGKSRTRDGDDAAISA